MDYQLIILKQLNGKTSLRAINITEREREIVLRAFEKLPDAFSVQKGIRVAKSTILGVREPLSGSTPFDSLRERLSVMGVSLNV